MATEKASNNENVDTPYVISSCQAMYDNST